MSTDATRRGAWYAQPVLWLGVLLLGASLAGCAWLIVFAAQHADEPLPTVGDRVLKVPVDRDTTATSDTK